MLVTEGFLYLGGAFVIAVLLVVFGAEKILLIHWYGIFLSDASYNRTVPAYGSDISGIAYAIPKYQFKR